MKHLSPSLTLLRDANPVNVDPEAVRSPQESALLEQILTEPRSSQRGSRPRGGASGPVRGHRTRARAALGGVAICAVAAAVAVVALSGSTAAHAFAGWVARPTPAIPAQVEDLKARCGLRSPTLAEARGPYTAAVFTSRAGGSACVEGPAMSVVASIGGVQAPDDIVMPGEIQTSVLSGSDSAGHSFILLAGRVGSAVRAIVIHRSNRVGVVATISHGWYLAWWPAATQATDATVTTRSGVHNVALPPAARSSGAYCGGTDRACAGAYALSNGTAGVSSPPLVIGQLAKPFHDTILFGVHNARRVLVCWHPPTLTVAMKPNGPTGPCTRATRLTRLPSGYPVQKNLLEILPNDVWSVKPPVGTGAHGALNVLIVAFGGPAGPSLRQVGSTVVVLPPSPSLSQIRNLTTFNW
jgi:hypothetical protein